MSQSDPPSTNGLTFRSPLEELEEILDKKIQRYKDAGDRENANLYREVLELARREASPEVGDEQEETVAMPPQA